MPGGLSMPPSNPRTFVDSPAVRSKVPLLIGLSGPSGSGKTYSALRLATGIQRVTGGEIYGVDSEAKRMLALADYFKFRHVPFGAPFGPLDYLAAVEHCVKKGAGVVIVDSMSHEHEGPGGVLEQHDQECERMLSQWKNATRDSVQMTAWARPKAARRRLLNSLLQMECSFIFCFRAKDKIRPVKGGKPEELGWIPIAGEEFLYEQTINFMLPPLADGVPSWKPVSAAQELHFKAPPTFFRHLFAQPRQLDEAAGEAMAKWAAGGAAGTAPAPSAGTSSSTPAGPANASDHAASESALEDLRHQLGANGITSRDDQWEWMNKATGRRITKLAPATAAEVAMMLERAQDEAAA